MRTAIAALFEVLLAVVLASPALADDPKSASYVLMGMDQGEAVFFDVNSIEPGANSYTFQATTLSVDHGGYAILIAKYDCAARATKSEGVLAFPPAGSSQFSVISANTSVTSKWEAVYPHTVDDKVLATACGRRDLSGDPHLTEEAAIATVEGAQP